MRIQITAASLVVYLASTLLGAEPPKKTRFDVPEDWKTERIALPPTFAPDMKLQGTEEIWFAPGMFKPKSASFFSYMFVFQLKSKPELNQEVIEREILVYYRGLARSVLKRSKVEVDPKQFSLKLKQSKTIDEKAKAPAGMKRYAGDLKWVEPFATQKPQTLHLEVDMWANSKTNQNYLFVCVSPQEDKAAIWKTMRNLRVSFLSTSKKEAAKR